MVFLGVNCYNVELNIKPTLFNEVNIMNKVLRNFKLVYTFAKCQSKLGDLSAPSFTLLFSYSHRLLAYEERSSKVKGGLQPSS